MQVGIDSFAAAFDDNSRAVNPADLYRETGRQHGFAADQLKVGVHMLGYVGDTMQEAADTFFPGYAKAMTDVGKERGWRQNPSTQ